MGSPYKYIEFINEHVEEKGIPKLSANQLQRLLKIFALEYYKRALRSKNKNIPETLEEFKIGMKVTELSGNLKPEELLNEMERLSKDI